MPDSSSKHWWSRSKPATGISLNSIASAIGLKSKKHRPSLVIQDPPVSPSNSGPDRPSLARSGVDSIGPLTPVDYECQSMLSLFDHDPFAGRQNIPPGPVPQSPLKKTLVDDIMSSTSSLLLSTNHPCDVSTLSPTSGLTESWKLNKKRSIAFSQSLGSTNPLIHHTPSPSLSSKRPGSSSAAMAHSALPRFKLRPRGMTDSGTTNKAGFSSDERSPSKKLSPKSSTSTFSTAISSTENPSPRSVIRHTSLNRLIAPPCPPPAHSLPSTPLKAYSPISSQIARTGTSSPSCMSFASSSSNDMLPTLVYPLREKRYSERSVFSQDHNPEICSLPVNRGCKTVPSSPRKLKKALSHQSLGDKSNVPLPKLPPDTKIDKVFRKQKSLHYIRSPILPIPDRVGPHSPVNSTTFPSLPNSVPKAASESGNCSPGRKKIDSHSSVNKQPSTSHYTPTKTADDSLSLCSLLSDPSHLKPWASPKAAQQSSFWDETGQPVTSSSALSTSEYNPQPIISATEVAKLEASIENSHPSIRSRTLSLSSITTLDRENLDSTAAGLSPPPTAKPRSKAGSMSSFSPKTLAFHHPSSSWARSPPRSPSRSINGNPDKVSTLRFQPFFSESPAELATSLPPPPRTRQRAQLVSLSERSNPPPFSSSVLLSSRSKSYAEKDRHRRPIMKKPSFLEIDDDTDQDADLFYGESTPDSFLDMTRESFENSNDP